MDDRTMLELAITHRVVMRVDPERAWDALATGEGFDGWFTSGSEIDARPGGAYVFRWREFGPDRTDGEIAGTVLEAERPSRYAFRWNDHIGGTTVAFDIVPHPEGTLVTVNEPGYPDTPEGRWQFMDCAVGWGEALTLMRVWLEHGIRLA